MLVLLFPDCNHQHGLAAGCHLAVHGMSKCGILSGPFGHGGPTLAKGIDLDFLRPRSRAGQVCGEIFDVDKRDGVFARRQPMGGILNVPAIEFFGINIAVAIARQADENFTRHGAPAMGWAGVAAAVAGCPDRCCNDERDSTTKGGTARPRSKRAIKALAI